MRSLSLLLLAVPALSSAVPLELTHQGRLFDGSGVPLDGLHDLSVSLYDTPSGGTAVWAEDYTNLVFEEGYYQVDLGASTGAPLTADLFEPGELYMALAVDFGPELGNRLPLLSVPYAIHAGAADQATDATNVTGGTVAAASVTVAGVTIADTSGAVPWSVLSAVPTTVGELGCSTAGEIAAHDGTDWACVAANDHTHDAAAITGVLGPSQLPVGLGSNQVAAGDHVHGASSITGQFVVAQLPVGTTAADVAAGDHTHTAADVGALDSAGGTVTGDLTVDADAEVTGTLTVGAELVAPCAPGFVRLGGGSSGVCIQEDVSFGEAGCWGDECNRAGYRDCTCSELRQAIQTGRVNPNTDATNLAGEYCMVLPGHCAAPNPGGGCAGAQSARIGKIWPNPDPSALPDQFYKIPGADNVAICDTQFPSAHTGYPYGAARCCY